MYAIILTGGKQIKAEVGQVIYAEKLEGEIGSELTFDKVLYVDSDKVTVGAPLIAGATVKATIVKQGRGKKIRVLRYKSKKNVRVAHGHRQPFTACRIESINL